MLINRSIELSFVEISTPFRPCNLRWIWRRSHCFLISARWHISSSVLPTRWICHNQSSSFSNYVLVINASVSELSSWPQKSETLETTIRLWPKQSFSAPLRLVTSGYRVMYPKGAVENNGPLLFASLQFLHGYRRQLWNSKFVPRAMRVVISLYARDDRHLVCSFCEWFRECHKRMDINHYKFIKSKIIIDYPIKVIYCSTLKFQGFVFLPHLKFLRI